MSPDERRRHLDVLYRLLDQLSSHVGGPRRLDECHGRMGWPSHGVYFFFEDREWREDGKTPRVTRVGTHALTETSKTTLWKRLSQHRGSVRGRNPGGGNHRGSIFRRHVGAALIGRDAWPVACESWDRTTAPDIPEERAAEASLEREVSAFIGAMPFLWLKVPDRHRRDAIERGAISLISNLDRSPVDLPSEQWLGRHADREAIRRSGLWNVNHVGAEPRSGFLDDVRQCLHGMQRST